MMRNTARVLSLALVFALAPALFLPARDSLARQSPFFDRLALGPHPVGLEVNTCYDASRSALAGINSEGPGRGLPVGRPVRVYVWFPADAAQGRSPMKFGDYVDLAREDASVCLGLRSPMKEIPGSIAPSVRRRLETDADTLAGLETAAFARVGPKTGRFPVIVVGQGLFYESPATHALLCEYLASHGFVVATCPLAGTNSVTVSLDAQDLETQVRDMEFVLAQARKVSCADGRRVGLVGFDLGGMSALILAMRNADVDAVASLDSGIMYAHNLPLLRQSPSCDPRRLRAPLMHFTVPEQENSNRGVVEDFSLLDSATHSDLYLVRARGFRHSDFTSFALIPTEKAQPDSVRLAQTETRSKYVRLCETVVTFLKARVAGDEEAAAALARIVAAPPEPAASMSIRLRPGAPAPLTLAEFTNAILTGGVDSAVTAARRAAATDSTSDLLSEPAMNYLGYMLLGQWGLRREALEVFGLNAALHPSSANAYDSLGEAHLANSQTAAAVESYEKSLELDPSNANAVEMLKRLRGSRDGRD